MMHAAPPALFVSREALTQAFEKGLRRQAALPGIGTFILTLANASADPLLWFPLRQQLADRFTALTEQCRQSLRAGQPLGVPEDDLTVFLKLALLGFADLETTQIRQEGPWEIQYNPLRALRPARASSQKLANALAPPFSEAGFHFNKPFLRPEILWEGELFRHSVRLLYNKFPFVPLHGLLVPVPERGLPQAIQQEWHLFAWHVCQTLGKAIAGFTMAYNSYGAQASVNHLHFQTCVRDVPLPVESAHWQHKGGQTAYPVPCHTFTDPLDAWFFIDHLQQARQPYNLIYTPGQLYCLPRQLQGNHPQPAWSPGYAWYEMAGGMTAYNRSDFDRLRATDLHNALAQVA